MFPALRTLPSRICATPSFFATVGISTFWPLKVNTEVREVTFSSVILTNRFNISSVMPSEKYSCSESEDMLTKGSTAIDVSEISEVSAFSKRLS